MKQFRRTALSLAATQVVMLWSGIALAQTAPANTAATDSKPDVTSLTSVVTKGQRAALASAQKIKQDSDEIVDSIVADDIGKLPDRSVTEVLQRIVGVSMDRTAARSDPVHYSVEGSGINIRGLTYVSAQLNGRETFSANGGRSLGFEDVPPELMAGVDVYKNPSAEQIEGAIGGMVNLRTAMPFDFKGFKATMSASETYADLRGNYRPSVSGLISNTWETSLGKFGALIDLAHSESATRTDTFVVDPYYQTTTSKTVGDTTFYTPTADGRWFPRDMGWRQQNYDRTRDGIYGALQWKNDNMESSLTYFGSKYKFAWNEYSVSAQVDPQKVVVSNATYDAAGRMLTGVLTNPSGGNPLITGIEVENGTRYSSRESHTQELDWKFSWSPNKDWVLTSDLQYITSKTKAFDSTVATGVQMPKQTLDLTGSMPRVLFDTSDIAYLSDPSKYYWATTMEHFDEGTATQKVWRGDARYTFEDTPYLTDLRFGVRVAQRDALTTNSNPSYNWATVTHAWQLGWNIDQLANITNYTDPTFKNAFSNFLGGKASVPAMYFPDASVAFGWPDAYTKLHDHYNDLCAKHVEDWYPYVTGTTGGPAQNACQLPWTPKWALATFDTDPAGRNDQSERTNTAYAQLRFGFDEIKLPVDGNVGIRVIQTKDRANGFTVLNVNGAPSNAGGLAIPSVSGFAAAQSADNTFTDVLPSLNLKFKPRSDLQFRFAWAKGLSRPSLDQMQAYTTMSLTPNIDNSGAAPIVKSITATGTASGNPMLRPVQSNQMDLTAEWYFNRTGSLTVAAFNKNLSDIIVNQTFGMAVPSSSGTPVNFVVTGPTNGADGYARGIELAYQQYFDTLPGWLSGFGLQANYTFVDSRLQRKDAVFSPYCSAGAGADNLNLFINGCDTDGRSFTDLPLPNLSRNTANLTLLYEKGPISARIAYSWRDRYMYGVALNSDNTGPNQNNGLDTNPNSANYGRNNMPIGLPLWADAYGQVDAGLQYKYSNQLTLSLEGRNLTDALYRQLMQQHIGNMGHNYFTSGRSYTLSAQYTF